MENTTAGPDRLNKTKKSWFRFELLALAVVLLIALGWFLYQAWPLFPASPGSGTDNGLTAEEFEEISGLRVHLILVTAGGGMIDFRMKIVDPSKAQEFLSDPAHLPLLTAADSEVTLMTPEGLDKDIEWSDGGILFNFYPNDGKAIEPGTPVIVQFGDLRLEQITAQ